MRKIGRQPGALATPLFATHAHSEIGLADYNKGYKARIEIGR
jgi:hypothetical protein